MRKTLPDQSTSAVAIRHQAIKWLIRLADESADAQDYAAWMAWMEKDRQHKMAFDRASSIWGAIAGMNQLSPLANPANENQIREFQSSLSGHCLYKIFNRRAISAVGLAVVILVVGYLISVQGYLERHEQIYSTDIAEIRKEVLPDNSTVILGAQTKIKVSYSHDTRRIALLRGEAYFFVHKDFQRPFYVTASQLSVRVVGTEFEIDKGIEMINVNVLKGKVSVSVSTKNSSSRLTIDHADKKILHKGQKISSTISGVLGSIESISSTDTPAAWRSGLLLYEDALLKEVVADINRYYKGEITLSTEPLGNLSVTASFKIDQIEEVLHSLDEVLPIDIVIQQNGNLLLKAKNNK